MVKADGANAPPLNWRIIDCRRLWAARCNDLFSGTGGRVNGRWFSLVCPKRICVRSMDKPNYQIKELISWTRLVFYGIPKVLKIFFQFTILASIWFGCIDGGGGACSELVVDCYHKYDICIIFHLA